MPSLTREQTMLVSFSLRNQPPCNPRPHVRREALRRTYTALTRDVIPEQGNMPIETHLRRALAPLSVQVQRAKKAGPQPRQPPPKRTGKTHVLSRGHRSVPACPFSSRKFSIETPPKVCTRVREKPSFSPCPPTPSCRRQLLS